MNLKLFKGKNLVITCLLGCILISLLILPLIVSAQGLKNINQGLDTTAQNAGVQGESSLIVFLGLLIQFLLGFIGLVFAVLIVYGGAQWMMAMGQEDKIAKAKKILTNSVIGLIIIMLSYAIAFFVTTALETAVN